MSEDKENTEKTLIEYEYLRGQVEALQEGIALIDASILQIDTTIWALNGAGSLDKDNVILLPVGSESFLSARITDTKNAIVGIGADVAVKKTIKEAITDLEGRKKDLENLRKERTEALEKAAKIAQDLAPKLQEILAKAQKEG
ncbi:MAG: prefoldin subunit alpha [Candidatus Hydrothermarchaeales archaeon]